MPVSLPAPTDGSNGTWPSNGTPDLVGQRLTVADTEQRVALAVVAGERAHVPDHACDTEEAASGMPAAQVRRRTRARRRSRWRRGETISLGQIAATPTVPEEKMPESVVMITALSQTTLETVLKNFGFDSVTVNAEPNRRIEVGGKKPMPGLDVIE